MYLLTFRVTFFCLFVIDLLTFVAADLMVNKGQTLVPFIKHLINELISHQREWQTQKLPVKFALLESANGNFEERFPRYCTLMRLFLSGMLRWSKWNRSAVTHWFLPCSSEQMLSQMHLRLCTCHFTSDILSSPPPPLLLYSSTLLPLTHSRAATDGRLSSFQWGPAVRLEYTYLRGWGVVLKLETEPPCSSCFSTKQQVVRREGKCDCDFFNYTTYVNTKFHLKKIDENILIKNRTGSFLVFFVTVGSPLECRTFKLQSIAWDFNKWINLDIAWHDSISKTFEITGV